jgi:hypothetical protein
MFTSDYWESIIIRRLHILLRPPRVSLPFDIVPNKWNVILFHDSESHPIKMPSEAEEKGSTFHLFVRNPIAHVNNPLLIELFPPDTIASINHRSETWNPYRRRSRPVPVRP